MSGTIALTRRSGFQLRPRPYRVWIDGVAVGRLAQNGAAEFAVDSGVHVVELSLDGMYSKKVSVEVREGSTRRLHCGAHGPLAFSAFGLLLPGLAIRLTLTH
ncbi:hypothetical protein [Catenulispora rubra]|uniref:hypothetical protein n=1 Tax=Catenulispora rubra TaxID=280293 RepID=UPI0018921E32|nr:hypothetical protein [Catenulispora rubra]